MFFLYAPIFVLIVFSFNSAKSNRVWEGFSLKWYLELFQDTRLGPLTDCTPIRHPCDVFEGTHLYGGHPAQVQCSFQPGVSKRLSCNFSCHLGKVKGLQLRTVGKCLFPDFRYLAPFPQDHLL